MTRGFCHRTFLKPLGPLPPGIPAGLAFNHTKDPSQLCPKALTNRFALPIHVTKGLSTSLGDTVPPPFVTPSQKPFSPSQSASGGQSQPTNPSALGMCG